MAGGVSPSDLSYFQSTINDYQRANQELAENQRQESERTEKRHKEDVEALERSNERTLQTLGDQYSEAAEDGKRTAQEAALLQRAQYQEEVKNLKGQIYNQFGKMAAEERAEIERKSNQTLASVQDQAERNKYGAFDTDSYYQKRIDELNDNHAKQLSDVTERSRDAALETYHRSFEQNKNDQQLEKEALQKKYEMLSREQLSNAQAERIRAVKAINDSQIDAKNRISKAESNSDNKYQELAERLNYRAVEDARKTSESRANETYQLRKQIGALSDLNSQNNKGHAEGREEAIKEHETETALRENTIINRYEDELSKQKGLINDAERRLNEKNIEALREKDGFYSKVLNDGTVEHHQDKKDLLKTFELDRKMSEVQLKKEKENSDRQLLSQADNLARAREEALKAQSNSYQKTLTNQSQQYKDEMRQLETANRTLRTTEDVALISPAAENAVRNSIERQHEKVLNQLKETADRRSESQREAFQANFDELDAKNRDQFRRMQYDHVSMRDGDRSVFNRHVAEITENSQENTLRQEDAHQRTTLSMQKTQSRDLGKLRQEYEDVLSARQIESESRNRESLDQVQFEKRMMQRDYAMEQRSMIRNYEKKLQDQREEYQSVIDELKLDMEKVNRQAQKSKMDEVQAQQKAHERQMTQLEQQQKERERVLIENYETELDNARKAHARIIRSKG